MLSEKLLDQQFKYKGLIKNYFLLSYSDQMIVRRGIYPQICTKCGGEGVINQIVDHVCDCEYCEIEHEEDTETIKCYKCDGAGEAIDERALLEALGLLRQIFETAMSEGQ